MARKPVPCHVGRLTEGSLTTAVAVVSLFYSGWCNMYQIILLSVTEALPLLVIEIEIICWANWTTTVSIIGQIAPVIVLCTLTLSRLNCYAPCMIRLAANHINFCWIISRHLRVNRVSTIWKVYGTDFVWPHVCYITP